jgi:hypothetical protein
MVQVNRKRLLDYDVYFFSHFEWLWHLVMYSEILKGIRKQHTINGEKNWEGKGWLWEEEKLNGGILFKKKPYLVFCL